MSNKHYYAGYNSYGTSFTYDSPGWFVHAFASEKERDDWVKDDDSPNGNPTREKISSDTAYKLAPDLRTQPIQQVDDVILHE